MTASAYAPEVIAALAPAAALSKEGVAKPVSEANLLLQAQITAAFKLLRATRALSPSNSSNISVRIPGTQRFVIAGPNIASDQTVGESSAAVVDPDGNHYEGRIGPGIQEVISVHGAVYRLRPEVGAVIHTHSTNLTSFAIAHRDLPVSHPPLLAWNSIPLLPTTVWAPRYSPAPVLDTLARHPQAAGVLLGNRGTLLFGRDALDAARHTVYLEEAAGIAIDAAILGGAKPLPAEAFTARATVFSAPPAGAVVPRPAAVAVHEAAYRLDAELGRILSHLHANSSLALSRNGIGSQRLADGNLFAIGGFASPVETERSAAVVVALDGTVIAGDPSAALRAAIPVHAALYRERPKLGAQLYVHTPGLAAFAAAQRPLPVRYSALLRQSGGQIDAIPVAPWSADFDAAPVVATVAAHPGTPAVLLANRGALVLARSLEIATRLVTVLEEGADFVIKAERLGGAQDFPPGAFAAVAKGWNPDA